MIICDKLTVIYSLARSLTLSLCVSLSLSLICGQYEHRATDVWYDDEGGGGVSVQSRWESSVVWSRVHSAQHLHWWESQTRGVCVYYYYPMTLYLKDAIIDPISLKICDDNVSLMIKSLFTFAWKREKSCMRAISDGVSHVCLRFWPWREFLLW